VPLRNSELLSEVKLAGDIGRLDCDGDPTYSLSGTSARSRPKDEETEWELGGGGSRERDCPGRWCSPFPGAGLGNQLRISLNDEFSYKWNPPAATPMAEVRR
jgi:hypothetical protein